MPSETHHITRYSGGTVQYMEYTGTKRLFSQFSLFPIINSWADNFIAHFPPLYLLQAASGLHLCIFSA